MIPGPGLSSQLLYAPPRVPDPQPSEIISRELGGVALNDPTQGLEVKIWTLTVTEEDEVSTVWVEADDVPAVSLFSDTQITEASLAFDQNMQPTVSYVSQGETKLYWYDSEIEGFTTTVFGNSYISPRVTLDDHRYLAFAWSDVIFSYIRDGNLYVRAQRDRYGEEYLMYADINLDIISPRIQWICLSGEALPRMLWYIRGNFTSS